MDAEVEQELLGAHVERLRTRVDEALSELVTETSPASLYESVRYVLSGGGKRFRPILLLLASEALGSTVERALPAALAVEVFHNFTLVHDDIMDRSDERRGRPTVHVRWGTDTAILCGDYLMGLAYAQLSRLETDRLPRVLEVFSRMVERLCEGQALDKDFEVRSDVTVEEYLHMVDGKTGALVQAALEIGGLVGSASERQLLALRRAGALIGRAFQIQDDLLDLTADDARWGKPIGGDLIEGKKTLLILRTLERTEGPEHAWFARVVHDGGLPESDVAEARERMERLGILDEARNAVVRHTSEALECLETLPSSEALATLRWLLRKMQRRLH